MANRAYLFCSDGDPNDPQTWANLDKNKQHYYDSRHNIPLSWFFFFQPHDVKLVDVFFANGYLKAVDYWQEPKFMADKQKALEVFEQNEALLAQIVGPGLYSAAFARFLPSLQRMPGDCLCMDPAEIAQGDEEDYLPLKEIVELISNKDTPVQALREALNRFSMLTYKDENDASRNVIGCTYW
jgi:hypothetical protein